MRSFFLSFERERERIFSESDTTDKNGVTYESRSGLWSKEKKVDIGNFANEESWSGAQKKSPLCHQRQYITQQNVSLFLETWLY